MCLATRSDVRYQSGTLLGWGALALLGFFALETLMTETRTHAVDERARQRFRLYWRFISPFAGLTRRLVLSRIKAEAERGPAGVTLRQP